MGKEQIILELLVDEKNKGTIRLSKAHRDVLNVELGEMVEIKKGFLFHSASAEVVEALPEDESKDIARVSPDILEEGNFKVGDKCKVRKILLE